MDAPPKMPLVETRQAGLVAFFDILGYQNFVVNNDVEDGVQPILQALSGMPASVKAELLGRTPPEPVLEIIQSTNHLVFSDTILLTCPVKADLTEEQAYFRWMIFALQAALLQRKMFHFGFPVRGVITFGNFVHEQSCFAGRAIIEAYQLVGELDAAAVVFSPSAGAEVRKMNQVERVEGRTILSALAVEYLIPMKHSEPRKLWTVNFTKLVKGEIPPLDGDARDLVAECFWKHNKDLPPSAYGKLTNTELLLRFLRNQP